MTLDEEIKRVTQEGEKLIPPYRLNLMTQTVSKIVKLLTDGSSAVTYGYEDIYKIIGIVKYIFDLRYQEEHDRS